MSQSTGSEAWDESSLDESADAEAPIEESFCGDEGVEVDNCMPGGHVQDGTFLGYGTAVHRGEEGFFSRSPDVPWNLFRAVILAARSGTDAMLDAAAASAWGSWWANVVVARGQRGSQRLVLANYLPLGFPVP